MGVRMQDEEVVGELGYGEVMGSDLDNGEGSGWAVFRNNALICRRPAKRPSRLENKG